MAMNPLLAGILLASLAGSACAQQPPGFRPANQAGAADASAKSPASGHGAVRFSIGNLSVPLLFQSWGSPLLEKLPREATAAHRLQRDSTIARARMLQVQALEDYVGWGVVEPQAGKWDWSAYKENAKAVKQAGFKYIVFGWVQNLPRWARNERVYQYARCIEHHEDTEMLSIFSPRTVEAYDRFYAKMRAELGEHIDLIRIGSPYDYGEVAYPAGAASWAFPVTHVHEGFWVDEPEARAHFRHAIKIRYSSLDRLNAAWATTYKSFDSLDYPRDNTAGRYWLDFIGWYQDALTERMGVLVETVKKHFPDTPLLFSFGWPYEKDVNGHDISGLTAMAASKGVEIRAGAGPSVPFLNAKHVATAARHYKLRGRSSEPTDGSAPREALALSLFEDLTTGMTWHFDYPENMSRAPEIFRQADAIWRSGVYPQVRAALFFSTSSHRLASPLKPTRTNGPDPQGGYRGYPDGLIAFGERLRDALDFDVVDERLVADGVLASYRVLLWPAGYVAEAGTMARIRRWVEAGGTLIVGELGLVVTVDGQHVFNDLRSEEKGKVTVGRGSVVDGRGRLEFPGTSFKQDLSSVAAGYRVDHSLKLDGWLREVGSVLSDEDGGLVPVLDDATDGILVSQFADGVVLFNSGAKPVSKLLKPGRPNLPPKVDMPPLALRWVDGKTGEIRPR